MRFDIANNSKDAQLVDPFGRSIDYLRLSVTDRCDFRCVYCMSENMHFLPKADILTLEELDRLATVFIEHGVKRVRLTGGEPLVRKGIMTLVLLPLPPSGKRSPPGVDTDNQRLAVDPFFERSRGGWCQSDQCFTGQLARGSLPRHYPMGAVWPSDGWD